MAQMWCKTLGALSRQSPLVSMTSMIPPPTSSFLLVKMFPITDHFVAKDDTIQMEGCVVDWLFKSKIY